MPATKRPPPPTRPSLTGIVPSDQTPGRSVTVADFIIEQLKAGVDPANAAGTAGVTTAEMQGWIREGVLGFVRLNAGEAWLTTFTPYQQDCALFADRALRARSTHISFLSIVAEQAARGTLKPKTTVRTRTVNGQVVERVETVETSMPDPDMLRWKLERLEPQVYGQRATLNLTVTDLTDTTAFADSIEKRMQEIARALAVEYPDAIDAASAEGPL